MAKRTSRRANSRAEAQHFCRECAHSYDPHSKALDGSDILCRCPFKQQGGKFCIFLKDPACERFKPRPE